MGKWPQTPGTRMNTGFAGCPLLKQKWPNGQKKVGFYKNFYHPNHFKNIKTQIKVANDQKPKYKSDHKKCKKEEGMYPPLLFFIGII